MTFSNRTYIVALSDYYLPDKQSSAGQHYALKKRKGTRQNLPKQTFALSDVPWEFEYPFGCVHGLETRVRIRCGGYNNCVYLGDVMRKYLKTIANRAKNRDNHSKVRFSRSQTILLVLTVSGGGLNHAEIRRQKKADRKGENSTFT